MDIFRERVFLRSEEHGSRIIPLVQLQDEVEALGEVLMTAETRSRLVGGRSQRAPRRPASRPDPRGVMRGAGEPQAGPAGGAAAPAPAAPEAGARGGGDHGRGPGGGEPG